MPDPGIFGGTTEEFLDDEEECEQVMNLCSHSIPQYGKPHSPSVNCWCQPESDPDDIGLWYHHTAH